MANWYDVEDPWGYQSHPDDLKRYDKIIEQLWKYGPFDRALDIGAGEGWITGAIPAMEIHGIEIDDQAAKRFPDHVKRLTEPDGKYDLVMATGVLYRQYDWEQMAKWIEEAASGIILISGIEEWAVPWTPPGVKVHQERFKYREYYQRLRIYDLRLS